VSFAIRWNLPPMFDANDRVEVETMPREGEIVHVRGWPFRVNQVTWWNRPDIDHVARVDLRPAGSHGWSVYPLPLTPQEEPS